MFYHEDKYHFEELL